MNLVDRIKHIWALSEYTPGQPKEEYEVAGTEVSMIVKKPGKKKEKTVFFSRVSRDPVKEIVNETQQ